MSTVVEIEAAVEALPKHEQAQSLEWLSRRLNEPPEKGEWKWPVLPAISFPITQQEIDDAIDAD